MVILSNCTTKTLLNFTSLGPYMQHLPGTCVPYKAICGHMADGRWPRPTANGQALTNGGAAEDRAKRQTESAIACLAANPAVRGAFSPEWGLGSSGVVVIACYTGYWWLARGSNKSR
jgi:hypothetical protein